ncbi:hypothetical protein [Calothrix anomala]|nr:hypothetical protein [Calothrix anomala]MBD2228024.1 hypothetical protein [Calothrix anomala FACHB-343]
MTNIQTIRESINDFLIARVRIDYWQLEYPSEIYAPTLTGTYPANSLTLLPVQNVLHYKEGFNQIKTLARFPYRLAYRFPGQLNYHSLPHTGLEGIISYIQTVSLLESPDPDIESFTPVKVEDSITVSNTDGSGSDWLIYLNFAFDVKFNTTSIPGLDDIQSPDYYDFNNPPPLEELKIRIYRAKEKFITTNNSTYNLDSEINIIP